MHYLYPSKRGYHYTYLPNLDDECLANFFDSIMLCSAMKPSSMSSRCIYTHGSHMSFGQSQHKSCCSSGRLEDSAVALGSLMIADVCIAVSSGCVFCGSHGLRVCEIASLHYGSSRVSPDVWLLESPARLAGLHSPSFYSLKASLRARCKHSLIALVWNMGHTSPFIGGYSTIAVGSLTAGIR